VTTPPDQEGPAPAVSKYRPRGARPIRAKVERAARHADQDREERRQDRHAREQDLQPCPYCLSPECSSPATCGAELDEPEPEPELPLDTVLVTTEEAAEWLGIGARSFRTWARRRAVEPVHRVRVGRSWRALYDLDHVSLATRRAAA
jgi:hypothetical protein